MKWLQKKKGQYPSKTELNLAVQYSASAMRGSTVAAFLILLIAVGGFTKILVLDQLNRVNAAQDQVAVFRQQLDEEKAANDEYESVAEEYDRYFYTGFTDEELSVVDRMEILNLLEEKLMSSAKVEDVSVSGNSVSVNLSDLSLQQLSDLISRLKESEIVEDVTVYSAGTGTAQGTTRKASSVSMTIELKQAKKDGTGR